MHKYLVQDIEAIPESEIYDMWPEEKAKRELNTGRPVHFEDIWVWKVVCIGMLVLDDELRPVNGGCAAGGSAGQQGEKAMIQRWSDVVSGKFFDRSPEPETPRDPLRMVDWNGAKFDVPVLQTRAFRYGIPLPWLFGLQPDNRGGISQWSKEYRDKYAGKHDDVSEIWTNRGSFQKPSLANLARLMGLPGKVGLDGAKVYDAFKEGRHEEIDTYCMEDVIQTAFVFQRFSYMAGRITKQKYQAAASALLDWTTARPAHASFLEKVDVAALLLSDILDVVPSS